MHYNANTARRIFKYLNTKNIPRQGDILNNYKKLKRLGNIKKEGLHRITTNFLLKNFS